MSHSLKDQLVKMSRNKIDIDGRNINKYEEKHFIKQTESNQHVHSVSQQLLKIAAANNNAGFTPLMV